MDHNSYVEGLFDMNSLMTLQPQFHIEFSSLNDIHIPDDLGVPDDHRSSHLIDLDDIEQMEPELEIPNASGKQNSKKIAEYC